MNLESHGRLPGGGEETRHCRAVSPGLLLGLLYLHVSLVRISMLLLLFLTLPFKDSVKVLGKNGDQV